MYLGVLFAYWACFIATKDEDLSSETTINNNINFVKVPKSSQSSLTLHNPTPIHPKANQIISFPITLASVIIHFPEDLNDLQNDLIDNNNNIGIHPKAYMV